jgi:hypothetical protein
MGCEEASSRFVSEHPACCCPQDQATVDKASAPAPGSCRSDQAFNLLSVNGTAIPVRMKIKLHEEGDPLLPTVTYRVRFENVPAEELDNGRRLLLLLDKQVCCGGVW